MENNGMEKRQGRVGNGRRPCGRWVALPVHGDRAGQHLKECRLNLRRRGRVPSRTLIEEYRNVGARTAPGDVRIELGHMLCAGDLIP